jgi:hypothetical protein
MGWLFHDVDDKSVIRLIPKLGTASSVSCSYSSPPWLGAVKIFWPSIFAFPSHSPHHCPFTPVEPEYGDDLYEADYLLLFLAADLRILKLLYYFNLTSS